VKLLSFPGIARTFFFTSYKLSSLHLIFRISGWKNKAAKYLWAGWLVSGYKSEVITLDFGGGS
jgi:hypothetical protein